MKVYVLNVFESGDMTTSPWGVYFSKEDAEKEKVDLLNGDLNKDGYYLEIDVTEHEVI